MTKRMFRIFFLTIFSFILLCCSVSPKKSNLPSEPIDEDSTAEDVTNELETLTVAKNFNPIYIMSFNQSTELCFLVDGALSSITYQWYECSDLKTNNSILISNENAETFSTPGFTQKGIRYFYCVAKTEKNEIRSNVAVVAYTGLPLVRIVTSDNLMPTAAKEKHNGRMYLIKNGETIYDSGDENDFSIKVRGNATSQYPKAPYKLKLPKKANLLSDKPLKASNNKDKNWVLLAGYCDKTLLRNKTGFFVASIFNEIEANEKLYVPNSEFVDVVINGIYLGNYCLTDSIKEGNDRVNVNQIPSEDAQIGIVAEFDNYYSLEPKWLISDIKEFPYTFKFPDTEENDVTVYNTIATFGKIINQFEASLYNDDPLYDWKEYIDIESFARWYLVHNILANIDTNYFLSKKDIDDSSKIIMGPIWDFEWSIGIGWYDGERPRPADYWCVDNWYFSELLEKPEFINELKNQWAALKQKYPNLAEVINAKMDEFAQEINVSQTINFMVWDILDKKVSVGGEPLGSYEAELECDKQFIVNHISWLDSAIDEL